MKISATFFVSKNVELKLSAVQFRVLSRRLRATLPEGESIFSLGACAPLSPKGKAFPPGRFETVRQEVFPFDRDSELKSKTFSP